MSDGSKFTLKLSNKNPFSVHGITKAILKRILKVEDDNELEKRWQARLVFVLFRTLLLLVLWVTLVAPLTAHALQTLFNISPDISENVLEVSGLVFAISYDIIKGRLQWAIFYLIWYAWFVLSGKIPASVLAAFNLSGQAYALEACTMLVIITFVIGSWRLSRWVSAGGCIATIVFWVIWFNAAYDFLSITFLGFLPAYPVYGQQSVKDPPYDFALMSWTACGLLALLITVTATCFVLRDVFLGIRWVAQNPIVEPPPETLEKHNTYPIPDLEQKEPIFAVAQQTPNVHWTQEYEDAFQNQNPNTIPNLRTDSTEQFLDKIKQFFQDIGTNAKDVKRIVLVGKFAALLFHNKILSNEKAKDFALGIAEFLDLVEKPTDWAIWGKKLYDRFGSNEKTHEKTPEQKRIEKVEKVAVENLEKLTKDFFQEAKQQSYKQPEINRPQGKGQ